jgi:hypothetical protein
VPPGTSIVAGFEDALGELAGAGALVGTGAGAAAGAGAGVATGADEFCAGGIGPASCDQDGVASPKIKSGSTPRTIRILPRFIGFSRDGSDQEMRPSQAEMLAE